MPTPKRTSREEIVAAAASALEAGGVQSVTMQAVAERVGVRAPSLYKRVRDRDELLLLVAEDAAEDLTARLAASESTLPAYAHAFRAFAHARPEGFRLVFASPDAADATERAARPVLDACREIVGATAALDAARLFTAWAVGFLTMELLGAFRLGGDVDGAFAYGITRILDGLAGDARHPASRPMTSPSP